MAFRAAKIPPIIIKISLFKVGQKGTSQRGLSKTKSKKIQ